QRFRGYTTVCQLDAKGLEQYLDPEITFAPKRGKPETFVNFYHKPSNALEYQWMFSDGRIGGYVFEKEECSVKLYVLASPYLVFSDWMLHISFCAADWIMLRDIWSDLELELPVSDSTFTESWNSSVYTKCYHIHANCLEIQGFILCSEDYRIETYVEAIFAAENDVEKFVQGPKVRYLWKDMLVLSNVFKKVDRFATVCTV
ncbi:hypothetical protein AALO_G00009530, partial [Alosa alosa]